MTLCNATRSCIMIQLYIRRLSIAAILLITAAIAVLLSLAHRHVERVRQVQAAAAKLERLGARIEREEGEASILRTIYYDLDFRPVVEVSLSKAGSTEDVCRLVAAL